tara:strand:- start:3191 stop:3757 length:567 start_codon:yes stop_codon:yes gene_type:complete
MEKQSLLINVNGTLSSQVESYHIDLIADIANSECNIEKISFDRIYDILTGHILVSGKWNQIAILETNLAKFIENNSVNIDISKIKTKSKDNITSSDDVGYIPYEININNIDETGIINKIVDFLAFQSIEIVALQASVYESEYKSKLIKLKVKVKVSGDLNISSLKEQFDIMCYDESFDATFKVQSLLS